MSGPERDLLNGSLEQGLVNLVMLRASQINGCACCIDAHLKDLRALGDDEERLCSLDAWRECPFYTDRERAALAWTEAVTLIGDGQVSDADYEVVRSHFTVKELADLMLAVAAFDRGSASPLRRARNGEPIGRPCRGMLRNDTGSQ